jgi:hypothetical protein
MIDRSTVQLRANVMVEMNRPSEELHHIPGDYAVLIYGSTLLGRKELIRKYLTPKQQLEHEQYLVCNLCRLPCAGTCSR